MKNLQQIIPEYIPRKYYLDRIKPFIYKDVIKIIIGQRRVGKSYLLFQLMDYISQKFDSNKIIYINKELNEFSKIKSHTDLIEYIKQNNKNSKEKCFVFIDEIQEIAEFEKAIRSLLAEKRYDIYCSGSNANLLSSEIATHLAGRYIEFKVYSLSYMEFLSFHNLNNDNNSLLNYFKYGGLPYLIHLKLEDRIIYEYLRNIYNTILFKDIVARYQIRNINFLERLVGFLADNTGSLVSAKKISDFLKSQKIKISPNIILNYLSYLSSAFFVFQVPRSDLEGKRIFEIGEKYYFEDLGLRHSLIGYSHRDINKILENIIFLHMKILGFEISTGNIAKKEIDFICTRENKKVYIQAAYQIPDQRVFDREFGNLLLVKDNYPKIVVSMDETTTTNYQGIDHFHVKDF